jgi:hypothetical protein
VKDSSPRACGSWVAGEETIGKVISLAQAREVLATRSADRSGADGGAEAVFKEKRPATRKAN